MKYFAYGSNMSLARLQERVPNATFIGGFYLKGHQLKFHKSSDDGSGKCDTFATGNILDTVYGGLFEISQIEKQTLDKVEGLGLGYEEKIVKVYNEALEEFEAITYYATKIKPSLKPYAWYLNHVVIGAREVKVPADYLTMIESTQSIVDPDKNRDASERAMYR